MCDGAQNVLKEKGMIEAGVMSVYFSSLINTLRTWPGNGNPVPGLFFPAAADPARRRAGACRVDRTIPATC
jgi:hypothetical protein